MPSHLPNKLKEQDTAAPTGDHTVENKGEETSPAPSTNSVASAPEGKLEEGAPQSLSRQGTGISYVVLSLLFATVVTLLLYKLVGFDILDATNTIIAWNATICAWGWISVFTLLFIDRTFRKWQKVFNLPIIITLSLALTTVMGFLLYDLL